MRFLENSSVTESLPPWKVLVVDDDDGVHAVTRIVLRGFTFEGRPLEIHDVYSGREAREFLGSQPDIAVVLLDVVMEEQDSGLRVVRYLRDTLGNILTRIILRTGQPGAAPEGRIILEYDINDYKEKIELTRQKLFTSVVSALRSYRDLLQIDRGRVDLRNLVQASGEVLRQKNLQDFCGAVLDKITGMVTQGTSEIRSPRAVVVGDDLVILAARGAFSGTEGRTLLEALPSDLAPLVHETLSGAACLEPGPWYTACLGTCGRNRAVVCVELSAPMDSGRLDRLRLFQFTAGIGLNNLFLNREVSKTQRELVFRFGELVEIRTGEPGTHVRRVTGYAEILFRDLRNPCPGETEAFGLVAALHDVGKIGIPDRILNKTSVLDAEEFAVMKTHTTIGWQLLKASPLPIFQQAAEVALCHHERWDGSGYPRGLLAEEIPLSARITSIAEVFDALTSPREYRKPWTDETALGYLMNESGKAFDPVVVSAFFRNMDSILALKAADGARPNPYLEPSVITGIIDR